MMVIFIAMVLIPLSELFKPHGEILPVTLIMAGLMRILYAPSSGRKSAPEET